MNQYKIIDFHTHPFRFREHNICSHIPYCHMSAEDTESRMRALGVVHMAGSVIRRLSDPPQFAQVRALNDEALALRELYQGFYIPGFHIHPYFVKESIEEIRRMAALGVHLIGELVPYQQGWKDFTDPRLYEILEAAEHYRMTVNFHALGTEEQYAAMDQMVRRFPKLVLIGAHPSEGSCLLHHMSRLEESENYYVDLSGGGMFRHGTVRHLVSVYGKERILFGSDYPTCNLAMFVGGVALDSLLSEEEKEYIFYKNAKKILHIKEQAE